MLDCSDVETYRHDSLYSYRSVFYQGNASSALYQPLNSSNQQFAGWRRYYHGMHDLVGAPKPAIGTRNPYLSDGTYLSESFSPVLL